MANAISMRNLLYIGIRTRRSILRINSGIFAPMSTAGKLTGELSHWSHRSACCADPCPDPGWCQYEILHQWVYCYARAPSFSTPDRMEL